MEKKLYIVPQINVYHLQGYSVIATSGDGDPVIKTVSGRQADPNSDVM